MNLNFILLVGLRFVRCGDHTWKAAFPELYSISRSKEVSVESHRQISNNSILWNINFIILVHNWEVDSITSFYDMLIPLD